ncbi:MAG: rhomboid family intramembrane serine protease [Cohaesibacter sp.]|jgi:membrane associated rhomboid family serine protease|nr:rhomboid family intramembrane serine protease [Cohaesibacter sp.]
MFFPLHDKNALTHVRLQYITLALIALNIILFVFTTSGTGNIALQDYALAFGLIPQHFSGSNPVALTFSDPILWTAPLSYAFLHADWMHLLGNMAFLWVFGDNIEDAMGHMRFLLFYCLCAMGAAAVHILANWASPIPLIGASGATAGIIAAYLMLHPNVKVWVLFLGRIPLRIPALYCLGAWLLLQLYNSLSAAGEGVAWWAHVGGAATGALLIPFMKRKSVPLFDRNTTL